MSNQILVRLSFMLVSLLFGATSAWAIPTQPTHPHSHAPTDVAWPSPAPEDPEQANHFHVPAVANKVISTNLGVIGDFWEANSAWDDRTHRFADADNNEVNDLKDRFGHGYIGSQTAVRYVFAAGTPDPGGATTSMFANTFAEWDAKAGQLVQGVTTGTGLQLDVGINFDKVAGGASEFQVRFMADFQSERDAFAEWIDAPVRVNVGASNVGQVMTLGFEESPFVEVAVKGGGWFIGGNGAEPSDPKYRHEVGWSFDGTPNSIGNIDLDYECIKLDGCGGGIGFGATREGTEADFLALNLQLVTNTTHEFAAGDSLEMFEMDLATVIAHETGHVLGLLHFNFIGILMDEDIIKDASFGNTFSEIDDGSALGAAALYAIPVPEPGSLSLLGAGLVWIAAASRKSSRRSLAAP